MQSNDIMIRDYLLKRIARKNRRLSGALRDVVKSNRGAYNIGFNEILGFFANGLNGDVMLQIFSHIEANPSKRFAPYNYFDIDTLYSYDVYLQRILTETEMNARRAGHKWSNASDFINGFYETKSAWRRMLHESTAKNGYYNARRPVGVVRTFLNGKNVLSPKKTLTDEQFAKKYNENECVLALDSYIEMKHIPKKVFFDSEKQPKTIEEETITFCDVETYTYQYCGDTFKLEVIEKDYYVDSNGKSVIKIVAEGKEGRLYTTNYKDGSVYYGDLYDREGLLVEVDGGGQEFYVNKKFYDAFKAKKSGKKNITKNKTTGKSKDDDDNQIKLF